MNKQIKIKEVSSTKDIVRMKINGIKYTLEVIWNNPTYPKHPISLKRLA